MRAWIVALALLWPSWSQAELVRGPYLQLATSDSMTIVWRTDTPSSGRVRYGAAPDGLDQVQSTSTSTVQHEVRLTGLSPAQRYCYAIEDDRGPLAGGDQTHCFTTAPQGKAPFTFWVVGDSGTGSGKQGRVRDQMLIHRQGALPDVYLHVGDMAYSSGTDDEFQRKFFEMYPQELRQIPTYPAIGNHEGSSSNSLEGRGPYYDAYVLPTQAEAGGLPSGTEAYYSWDWGDVHFISLESQTEALRAEGGAMLTWLQMDLDATDKTWVVVYFHHPPYTKGSHDSDTELAHVQMRERALPILEEHGVDLVLGGHSHIYERSHLVHGAYDTPTTRLSHVVDEGDGRDLNPYHRGPTEDGAIYIVAGHGGTNVGRDGDQEHPLMAFTELANGSVLVDVDGPSLRVQNVRLDGAISDDFRLLKGEVLHLTGPRGRMVAGETVAITWLSRGSTRQVDLRYSTDAGQTWQPVGLALPDTGTYGWTVPDLVGAQVVFQTSDSATPAVQHTQLRPVEVVANTTVVYVPFGSDWRYSSEDPGEGWSEPGFDDRRWPKEPGSFGVCPCLPWEAGTQTFLADAIDSTTTYFRTTFTPETSAQFLDLSVIAESGVVVYINGDEVLRRDVDNDAHGAGATAQGVKVHTVRLPGEAMDPFFNTLAVAVKKSASAGVNLTFDLRLSGVIQPRPEATGCACRQSSTPVQVGVWLAVLTLWGLGRRRR